MKCAQNLRIAAVAVLWLFLSPGATLALGVGSGQDGMQGAVYASASWALGVVVPEGSKLEAGGGVRWEGASNVTASVTLPNITRPDGSVYAVLSVMTADGSILQGAAGLARNGTGWFAYSWCIPDVHAVPPHYVWVLNSSGPEMAPGSEISISVFRTGEGWKVRLLGVGTGTGSEASFPSDISSALKVGDQEVFALESYSSMASVFRNMGNLTLNGLYVDRERVISGFYPYGDWDPTHDPLFVVGGSGASPPSFIALLRVANGTSVWSYSPGWKGNSSDYNPGLGVAFVLSALAASFVAVTLTVVALRKGKGSRSTESSTLPTSG